jgi:hypothetical protein
MVKPSDWDTLDEQGKRGRKRGKSTKPELYQDVVTDAIALAHLCGRYGDLCFLFLEDPEPLRNQLGRITVAPNDFYALFEVWGSPSAQEQYHATMVLLEECMTMDLVDFLRLKSMLGLRWEQPTKYSNKRPFDEGTSQHSSENDASDGDGAKRVRIEEPTPESEPDPEPTSLPTRTLPASTGAEPPPAVQELAPTVSRLSPAVPDLTPAVSDSAVSNTPPTVTRSAPAVLEPQLAEQTEPRRIRLSASEVRDIWKALFPAAAWEPAAAEAKSADRNGAYCNCPRTESHTCGRYTTISGTPYAQRLQALETTQQAQQDSHPRLCLHTGSGKKDAEKAETKHRGGVFTEFCCTVQSCTDIATSRNYDVNEVMQQVAVGLGVAKDPLLASVEFGNAGNVSKWAIVFWVFVKSSMAHHIEEIGASKWADHDLSARTELYQALQERVWQRFSALVLGMGRKLLEEATS